MSARKLRSARSLIADHARPSLTIPSPDHAAREAADPANAGDATAEVAEGPCSDADGEDLTAQDTLTALADLTLQSPDHAATRRDLAQARNLVQERDLAQARDHATEVPERS